MQLNQVMKVNLAISDSNAHPVPPTWCPKKGTCCFYDILARAYNLTCIIRKHAANPDCRHSTSHLTSNPPNCQDHGKQRKTEELWQLNAMCDPGSNPGPEKSIRGTVDKT